MSFLIQEYLKVLSFKFIPLALLLLLNGANSFAKDAHFFSCPESPNCVTTEVDKKDSTHYVEPFKTLDSSEATWKKVRKTVLNMPRTEIVEEGDFYFKAEVTSLIFRFVDDLEVSFFPETKTLSIKSASRVGYSDFDVNRERVEDLRVLLNDQGILSINPG